MPSPLSLAIEVTSDELTDPAVGPWLAVLDAIACHGERCAAFEHAALERAVTAVRGARRGVLEDRVLLASRASRSRAIGSEDGQAAALLRIVQDALDGRESPLWVWDVLGAGLGPIDRGDIFCVVDLARAEVSGAGGALGWLASWGR